ncbi:MAG: hypothetical protein ABII90_04765 [Bacteroidota bacterium]
MKEETCPTKVNLEVVFFKEGKYIIAYSPALDLSAYGDDIKDAKKEFEYALNSFLDYTTSHGTLYKELVKLGWQVVLKRPKPIYKKPPNIRDLLKKRFGSGKPIERGQFPMSVPAI